MRFTSIWPTGGFADSVWMGRCRITRRSPRTDMAARQSDLFRRVFESVLRRCIEEQLVGGEGFAVDASLIKADANRQKGIEGDKGLPPEAAGRAMDEYFAVLDTAAFGGATEGTPKSVPP